MTGVFGVPLDFLVEREGADSLYGASRTPLRVPSFIDDVVSAMRQMGMLRSLPIFLGVNSSLLPCRHVSRGHIP